MFHILKREFTDSFKSIRSILIILFITFTSYQFATFINNNPSLLKDLIGNENGVNSIYPSAIMMVMKVFGFLFIFAISHDLINKEIETNTIRLVVSKISRLQFMIGKMLGTLIFWIVTITISFGILFIISGEWFLNEYIQIIMFVFYIISLVLLLSTLITNPKLTMFLGIFLGIILPILGLVAGTVDEGYITPFKYILPYNYINSSVELMFIPFTIGLLFFIIAGFILQRKDL